MNQYQISSEQLRGFIERIEKLQDEKADIAENIRDVFGEAKANGFDTKAMREVLKLRAKEAHEREEQEHLRDVYMRAMGLSPEYDDQESDAA